jgi:hypothetical protein
MLHVGRGILQQALAMPSVRPEGRQRLGRAETAAEPAVLRQLLEPDGIVDVRLPPRDIFDVPGIDQEHLQTAGLQELEGRNPLHSCGFHRDRRDAEVHQPISHPRQIGRKTLIGAHGLWGPVRGHRHDMKTRPNVQPRRMGVDGE